MAKSSAEESGRVRLEDRVRFDRRRDVATVLASPPTLTSLLESSRSLGFPVLGKGQADSEQLERPALQFLRSREPVEWLASPPGLPALPCLPVQARVLPTARRAAAVGRGTAARPAPDTLLPARNRGRRPRQECPPAVLRQRQEGPAPPSGPPRSHRPAALAAHEPKCGNGSADPGAGRRRPTVSAPEPADPPPNVPRTTGS